MLQMMLYAMLRAMPEATRPDDVRDAMGNAL